MEGLTGNENGEIQTLIESTSRQFNDSDCRTAFVYIGKSKNRFYVDSDQMLVKTVQLDDVSEHVVLAFIQTVFLRSAFPLSLPATLGDGACKIQIRRCCNRLRWPAICTVQYMTAIRATIYVRVPSKSRKSN